MKKKNFFAVCLVLLFVNVLVIATPAADYPKVVLSTTVPTMNDSVSLRLTLGQQNNSCVPIYATRITIKQVSNFVCVRAPCAQDFVLSLHYVASQMQTLIACTQVITEYGPKFSLGKLAVGKYTVVDSVKNNDTVMVFNVTENSETPVIVSGFANAETTTVADVSFIVSTNRDRYVVGDSIKVRYVVKNNSMAKVSYDFSSGCQYDLVVTDQKKDTVYWQMKNRVCTAIMSQISLEPGESVFSDFPGFKYTGEDSILTISGQMIGSKYLGSSAIVKVPISKIALDVATGKTKFEVKKASLSYSPATKTLSIINPKLQNVSVSAYILNGQQISQLSCKKSLSAGTHTISLKKSSVRGVVVFKIEGDGFCVVKRINVMENK